MTSFSNRHPQYLDILAPGAILEAADGLSDGTIASAGTSFAAPFVSAAIGLLQQAAMSTTGERMQSSRIRDLLQLTGRDVLDEDPDGTLDNVFNTNAIYKRLDVNRLLRFVIGDLDYNDQIGAEDIAVLFAATDAAFDFNQDNTTDDADVTYFILRVLDTVFGDANLDGVFNSVDLTQIFTAGEYEDEWLGNSTWAEGDFDGDGDLTTHDLVVAMTSGGYRAT
jgi:hypothetical protein